MRTETACRMSCLLKQGEESRTSRVRSLGLIRDTVRAPYNTPSGRDSERLV